MSLLTYRGTVYPWHCDHVGHMNVMWYVGKFDEATWQLFNALGLSPGYLRDAQRGMAAYSELQDAEFASEANGYTATRHQREVGTGYFDAVSVAIKGGASSTTALADSTEAAQFRKQTALQTAAE